MKKIKNSDIIKDKVMKKFMPTRSTSRRLNGRGVIYLGEYMSSDWDDWDSNSEEQLLFYNKLKDELYEYSYESSVLGETDFKEFMKGIIVVKNSDVSFYVSHNECHTIRYHFLVVKYVIDQMGIKKYKLDDADWDELSKKSIHFVDERPEGNQDFLLDDSAYYNIAYKLDFEDIEDSAQFQLYFGGNIR